MKIKVIKHFYGDFNTLITIKTPYGEYIGKASLNPDEIDYASESTGYTIAYNRAVIKALKAKKQVLHLKTLGIDEARGALHDTKRCYEHPDYRKFDKQLKTLEHDYIKKIEAVDEEIEQRKKIIKSAPIKCIREKDKIRAIHARNTKE